MTPRNEPQHSSSKLQRNTAAVRRSAPMTLVWTVIFGVSLALGGSVLEPIPLFSITLASPLVALLITLDKLIVNTRFSVTGMYSIAIPIAVFTTYLGPPSPAKILFVLAALSFDAATLFRTGIHLKFWNIVCGHIAVTATGFAFFWVVLVSAAPKVDGQGVAKALALAAPLHLLISVIVAWIVYQAVTRGVLAEQYREIRSEIEDDR